MWLHMSGSKLWVWCLLTLPTHNITCPSQLLRCAWLECKLDRCVNIILNLSHPHPFLYPPDLHSSLSCVPPLLWPCRSSWVLHGTGPCDASPDRLATRVRAPWGPDIGFRFGTVNMVMATMGQVSATGSTGCQPCQGRYIVQFGLPAPVQFSLDPRCQRQVLDQWTLGWLPLCRSL